MQNIDRETNEVLERMVKTAGEEKGKLEPAPKGLPEVSKNLQRRYVQSSVGQLKHVGLLHVPGANRQEKKAFLRAERKRQQKAKQCLI